LDIGVFCSGDRTTVIVEDLIVREMGGRASDGLAGRGFEVQNGANADVRRLLLFHARDTAAVVDVGAVLTAEDVTIRDTLGVELDGSWGRAVGVQRDSDVDLTRLHVERSAEVAVLVHARSAARLADFIAREIRSCDLTGRGGSGIQVQEGSTTHIVRMTIDDVRSFGVAALGSAVIEVQDVRVDRVRAQACGVDHCMEAPFGVGIASYNDSSVQVTGFVVTEAELCGVHLGGGGALDLLRGEVARSTVGACVGVSGYDVARLNREVRYRENGTNLDATELPVPEPLEASPL
jgi:hypothetical protein